MPDPPGTVEGYLADIEEPRRGELTTLHELVRRAVPELKPGVQGGMIGYGSYHYRYPTGREGDAPVIALANNKRYISLYVMGTRDGQYVAETYRDRLPTADIGKSCVRFRKLDGVDLDQVAQLVRDGVDAMAAEPSVTIRDDSASAS